MYKSGIELPKVSFSTITYARIPLGGYFIGFDLDNSGKLSKIDNAGIITVIEGGGSSGLGVSSVTGLDTNNTDPQNPIVQIAVDGTTITGLGTPTSPLIANGISYSLPIASPTVLGGIKIGTGLSIDGAGVLSSNYSYSLPIASPTVLGGIKIGTGLSIDGAGVLSTTGGGSGASNFYLNGTITDAGSDKINPIERPAAIYIGADSYFNSVKIGMGLGNVSTNTAIGKDALSTNTTGYFNTAVGNEALKLNTTGHANVAVGKAALQLNTNADRNTAIGDQSLFLNTTGTGNTAIGMYASAGNTTGNNNIAIGLQSLYYNTIGQANISIGGNSLYDNTSGYANIGIGQQVKSGNFNNSIILGNQATATGSNQFVVGSSTVNAGTITTGAVTQTKYWSVIINGVSVKILLAD